jgi:hypothetical protein
MSKEYINANPNPEYLIKSIAEQGYSLETALADLIDNSITAKATIVEVLSEELKENEVTLFITDNGNGMSKTELSANMQFPSRSMEDTRDANDLGRFGLGLKTASFSQTRKFTVLSRKENNSDYNALTWDVKYLKETSEWRIIVNDSNEVKELLSSYYIVSENRNGGSMDYIPKTIIIWQGLYKFANVNGQEKNIDRLNKQLIEVTSEYLGIVFHRFIESDSLKIRMNHDVVESFNPFPKLEGNGLRSLGEKQNRLNTEVFTMEGFILPSSSTSQESEHRWKTRNYGLLDLEGIYVYRANRIIYFGGWNDLIKRESKLKLARLRIDIGNSNDDIFQLTIDKSSIVIPPSLIIPLVKYIEDLKKEAKTELSKRGGKTNSSESIIKHTDLFSVVRSPKGTYLEINKNFPLLKRITEEINPKQTRQLNILLKLVTAKFNYNKEIEYNDIISSENESGFTEDDILETIISLKSAGWSKEKIINLFLKDLGYNSKNFDEKILRVLNQINHEKS